jgi:threonine aldolase
VDQLKLAIRPHAYYLPPTKLICLENTHGLSGGSIVPLEDLRKVREFALAEKLKVHLDGARLWNACVATGISPREYAQTVDSLSVCFSKGLGAPIGSIIIGEKGFVERARKYRKVFGGGMRQAGVLAAAALYALDHHIDRLKEDHALAKYFGEELSQIKALGVDLKEVQTNMVFAEINATGKSQSEVLNLLKSNGLLMTPERHSAIRAVFHLGVSMPEVRQAVDIFRRLFGG